MTNKVRGYMQLHPYHLVGPSPWPMFTSFSLMNLATSIALTSHGYMGHNYMMVMCAMTMLYSMTLWFKDMMAESTYLGDHTLAVKKGMMQGFLLFVVSEMLIFVSLFWAYLHSALNPSVELGMQWPPAGMEAMSAAELPLLNTMMLLASGVTITFAHHALINGNRKNTLYGFLYSTLLIVIFVGCQGLEYKIAPFTISDSVYGSTFFSATGLHGLHMMMLGIMLALCTWRVYNYDFTNSSHVGAETTILYTHVLDVMWLFMYMVMYWWGA
uniref:Cytochrome c oxidase subunit 3 n=1 Tax=Pichia sorbitophila (strain ATCC MYA-4447 / BCRC 22081 / CBS 7064 / NBRC 10061 / NRRL Y-12695) TaxID=559304 RepID=C7U020_PICSO|nr:cytochrome c oxidase subunit 3 [Millerozyma farinosa]CAY39276.1 cytochrome c oxidase, subunit 3 [Millerozyma farinosa]